MFPAKRVGGLIDFNVGEREKDEADGAIRFYAGSFRGEGREKILCELRDVGLAAHASSFAVRRARG